MRCKTTLSAAYSMTNVLLSDTEFVVTDLNTEVFEVFGIYKFQILNFADGFKVL